MDSLSLFGAQKGNTEISVLFDVGNASVGAAIVGTHPHDKPEIIYTAREFIKSRSQIGLWRLILDKASALEIAATRLARDGFPENFSRNRKLKLNRIYCFLASPWYFAKSSTISIDRPAEFPLDLPFMDELIETESRKFVDSLAVGHKKDTAGKVPPVSNVHLLEQKMISAKLNGYVVRQFFDRKAKNFSATLFQAAAPVEVVDTIKRVLTRHFTSRHIVFHSFLLPFFTVARDLFSSTDSFILMDVTGEVTDLALVRRGALVAMASFPLGHNYIVREVSSILKVDLDVGLSFIKLLFLGKAEKDFAKRVAAAMEKAETEWSENFRETLTSLFDQTLYPKTVFMTADDDLAPLWTKLVSAEKLDRAGLTDQKFSVIHLNDERLFGLCDFKAKTRKDAFLSIESVFLGKVVSANPEN